MVEGVCSGESGTTTVRTEEARPVGGVWQRLGWWYTGVNGGGGAPGLDDDPSSPVDAHKVLDTMHKREKREIMCADRQTLRQLNIPAKWCEGFTRQNKKTV